MSGDSSKAVVSHWYHLTEGLETSALDFYKAVEANLERRGLSGVSYSRSTRSEAGAFSADREYLCIGRGPLRFEVCAAPFGKGYFFSWWLLRSAWAWVGWAMLSFALALGAAGLLFSRGLFRGLVPAVVLFLLALLCLVVTLRKKFFDSVTFYQLDTALMFQETVRRAVLEVVDEVTAAQGLRALSESERFAHEGPTRRR